MDWQIVGLPPVAFFWRIIGAAGPRSGARKSGPAGTKTNFWRCSSAKIQIPRATFTKRDDPLWEEDVVEVFIDPFGDLNCYFEFEVNPLNAVLDVFVRRVRGGMRKDFTWNCEGLRTATGLLAYGWVAGIAIPFKSMGDCDRSQWRINFCRIERPKDQPRELSAWSPTFSGTFHLPERFGVLKLEELGARRGAAARR